MLRTFFVISMKFVDIHTHKSLGIKDEIWVRNLSVNEAKAILAENLDDFFSVGIHPWNAENIDESEFQQLEILAKNENVKLIGECGLDKNREISFAKQLSVFEKQIQLSEMIRKPLIIHCVGYFNEIIALRKQKNPEQQWIIHGFRGKPQLAEQLLKAGFSLSFGERFNPESVKVCPIDQLFIETDESEKSVSEIYAEIAQIKNCTVEELQAGSDLLSC